MKNLISLADNLTKLNTSPANFSAFYRGLVGLRFPIEVADILELRYLFNHAIDDAEETPNSGDYEHFQQARQHEIESLGIEKKQHSERLIKLLTLIRQYHFIHSIESRDMENDLRKSLAQNQKARTLSIQYGRLSGIALILCAATWAYWFHGFNWLMSGLTLGLTYLTADYFYSLSTLKREKILLSNQLEEVLQQRTKALNWKLLIKNIALIMGHAKISGVEAFVIEEKENEDLYPTYLS